MKAVFQRVASAEVRSEGRVTGRIGPGAVILLADPPPELLVLDEPTNNLDLASVNELVDALASYRGGLIVVSHDEGFLARLGIDTWITLERDGRLR